MKVFISVLLLLATPAVADVYKTVTPDGEVIYSDVKTQGAKQMNVPKPQTYTPTPLPVRVNPPAAPEEKEVYSSFTIDSPVNKETIRDNLGNIPLLLTLEPELVAKDGHRIQYFLDGQPHGRPTVDTEKTYTNVDRGEHQVSAAVIDGNGTSIINTLTVNVFVHREASRHPNSPLNPNNPNNQLGPGGRPIISTPDMPLPPPGDPAGHPFPPQVAPPTGLPSASP
ncbi:MAG: DUF4124 domain-containing protein [Halobacteria archaeon]|nr:DUF4124 domain-containing protein [Halobacteria archaeon]